jgi:sec-independent protein translocase protein TatB
MFGFDSAELAIIAVLALIFIGPKELPRVMRTAGYWVGRVRGMARQFTSGIEDMVRKAEFEEMEKRWREENERLMSLHPPDPEDRKPGQPDAMPPVADLADVAEPSLPFDETQRNEQLPVEQRPLP